MNHWIIAQSRVLVIVSLSLLAALVGCAPAASTPRPADSDAKETPASATPASAPAEPAARVESLQPQKAEPQPRLAANQRGPAADPEKVGPTKPATSAGKQSAAKLEKPSPFAGAKWRVDDAEDEARRPKPRDLGPPLVDHPEMLSRLHPVFPAWIDAKRRMVVMVGEVVRSSYGLEMFISLRAAEKGYESVIEVDTQAAIIHAALLALGLEPGSPVKYIPQYKAPAGPEIEIELAWKDDKGQVQHARAQQWLKNIRTGKPLENDWVFTGSGFWKDETTGKEYFQAEGGYLVCVANTPSALLDLPIPSTGDLDSREFQPADSVPPKGTAVTVVLRPKKTK